mgnify:CR=1 FL=1
MKNEFLAKFIQPASTKIILLILDGLGGLPQTPGGLTELETAYTPHLDQLASQSSLGLTIPVIHGITNGSGPGHLAIFGYDPIEHEIGRGALEALGVDFQPWPLSIDFNTLPCAFTGNEATTTISLGHMWRGKCFLQ